MCHESMTRAGRSAQRRAALAGLGLTLHTNNLVGERGGYRAAASEHEMEISWFRSPLVFIQVSAQAKQQVSWKRAKVLKRSEWPRGGLCASECGRARLKTSGVFVFSAAAATAGKALAYCAPARVDLCRLCDFISGRAIELDADH